ncbi:MAG: NAD(P)/FAD-dependent oxidoreductase [Thermoplasmata archaeon]|nr:MAG: NAD(P)/FAD-dependent oxidoreductase [Thermoplasmata archaeon]
MKHYDVIVVGAGPAGGHVAHLLGSQGFDVGLFEEHNEIGRPIQCAGLVSLRVFDILGNKKGVLNEIKGAKVHSPSDQILDIHSNSPKACVIDRAEFDNSIVINAVDSGCDLHLGSKVKEVKRKNGKIHIQESKKGKKEDFTANLIVGCDGLGSIVARSFGFPKPKEVLSGFGAECIVNTDFDIEYVDIFVGNKIAPGFFAWLIPTGEGGARLGLCTAHDKKNTRHYFENLLTHKAVRSRLKDVKIETYITGAIPIGPTKNIVSDGVMLVGDSACQVKPLSGGGIYLGLLSGGYAANVAAGALEYEDVSEKSLRKYPQLVQADVGKELKRAFQLRKIYLGLKDKHIEEGFKILADKKVLSLIGKRGDIDYPSGLTKAVLKKAPRLMKFAGPVLKSLI